MDHAWEGFYTS
jgi:hypothetical protein